MIISRTPYRVSFFGGGTDYPAWYRANGGAVLATAIDKFIYISCRALPPFFEHRHRIVWSRIEMVKTVDEIEHPSVRECLRHLDVERGVEIHYHGDLPARTGMGSSSTFTVGLLNALKRLDGCVTQPMDLARSAIHVEQELIGENVGSQDQTMAAFGGFRRVEFRRDGDLHVESVGLPSHRLRHLQDHLMLVFSGVSRYSSDVAAEQVRLTPERSYELHAMRAMVDEALFILRGDGDITDFGRLLHEAWKLKRSLTGRITTPAIDDLYQTAMNHGALGGKLLGAGGGGFFLLFVPPERQHQIRAALPDKVHVSFNFSPFGSEIIYCDPDIPERIASEFSESTAVGS